MTNSNDPSGLTTLIDYAGTSNVTYIGSAFPGTAQAAAGWQIQMLSYSSGNVVAITYASGSNLFNQIWTSRSSLSYA